MWAWALLNFTNEKRKQDCPFPFQLWRSLHLTFASRCPWSIQSHVSLSVFVCLLEMRRTDIGKKRALCSR